MARTEMRPLRGTTAQWAANDIVPGEGELALELLEDGTCKTKIGDGISVWSALPYAVDFQAIAAATAQALAAASEAGDDAAAAEIARAAAVVAQLAAEVAQEDAEDAAEAAELSETNAGESATTASQALADLLALLGSDIPVAVDGKIPVSYIPATATQEIYTVTSEDELTGLTAQRGDLAELIETVDGEATITKTWQCLGDATVRANWVVWGTSYAVQAGSATLAADAENAAMINDHRLVEMTDAQFASAVKDAGTYYLVYTEAES